MFGMALLKICVGVFSHSSHSCLCGGFFVVVVCGFFW